MSIFLKIEKNATGRDYIVGDIHGHLDQLDHQLEEVTFDPSCDRLFCLGDLVDRGRYSESLLARIDQKTYFSTLGNHEAMMIAGFEGPEGTLRHKANGGEWFYELPLTARQNLVRQVRSWPWAIELDTGKQKLGLIHANVIDSNWPHTLHTLSSISEAWLSGVSFDDNCLIKNTVEKLLWDRSLAQKLYGDVLAMGRKKRTLTEYKSLFLERLHAIGTACSESLKPFNIVGIDALYLGHNFVPKSVVLGKCHFLDSYRGGIGERLSLVCVNEPD
ncbi:metallophosphoesterase [Microbulbifer epialgicus]|uniref:Metallophosphoesterase n=1 Tax=Microbulbifer epialgicus TaxID=393907 RepID=A0ABV4P3F8_9GAMM